MSIINEQTMSNSYFSNYYGNDMQTQISASAAGRRLPSKKITPNYLVSFTIKNFLDFV